MENTKTYLEYKKNANEKFVRDEEGAEMYHMSLSKFMQIAKNAKAVYKIGHMVLMKFEFLDEYLETFHIVDDPVVERLEAGNKSFYISKRYIRGDEVANEYQISEKNMRLVATEAGVLYRLPRTELIHKERLDDYMKHLYKVPGTNKQMVKKFVRIGEG